MANRWALQVNIDVPEPRPTGQRLLAAADGTTFDWLGIDSVIAPTGTDQFASLTQSNIWRDPVSDAAMLTPLCFTPDFSTNFSGQYARLASFDLTYDNNYYQWIEKKASGDWYLQSKTATFNNVLSQTNGIISTTTALSANQPMYVSYFAPDQNDSGQQELIRLAYGAKTNSIRTEFVIYKNGNVTVMRGVDGSNRPIPVAMFGKKNDGRRNLSPGKSTDKDQDISGRWLSIMILPYKDREILFVSNFGTSFTHICNDLPDGTYNQTILPADKFYFYSPATGTTVQFYKVKFRTAGSIYGSPIEFAYPPPVGATFTSKSYYSAAGVVVGASSSGTYGLVKSDFTTYTPNGTDKNVRVRIDLTGDGNGTICVEAADVYYDPPTTTTYNGPIDITSGLASLTIQAQENGPATITMTARRKKMIDLNVPQYNINTDRPIEVKIGGTTLFRGVLEAPKITYQKGENTNALNASLLEYNGQDRTADFNTLMTFAAVPYDNNTFQQTLQDLIIQSGYDNSYLNISTSTFKIPKSPEIAKGSYNFIPEFGDTIGKKIEDLHQTYAITWKKGWWPSATGYKYNFVDPTLMSLTPDITIYPSKDIAAAAGVPSALIHNRYYYDFNLKYESPEATAVSVVGVFPGINKLIVSRQRDSAAEIPGTAPASRPRNWAGKPIDFIYTDPSITTQAAADQAKAVLFSRLTTGRILAELKGPLYVKETNNVPLWIGSVIRVWNPNSNSYSDYRIISIPSIEFIFEKQADNLDVRIATYLLEKIS